jgi:hypothetical protein
MEIYLHFHNTPLWRGAQLRKAKGQPYLYQDLKDTQNHKENWKI